MGIISMANPKSKRNPETQADTPVGASGAKLAYRGGISYGVNSERERVSLRGQSP